MSARRLFLLVCLVFGLVGGSSATATTPGVNGRVVFGSARDGNPELYSVNADGSGLRRLTWTPQTEQLPAWSSDGGRIAYESDSGGRFRIWVMNADGSGQTQISPAAGGLVDDVEPAWSPDGTLIAFASTRAGTWNLWVMNADGSGLRRVSDVFATDPAWSPDGQQLAYVGTNGIGVVGVGGSNPHLVSAAGAFASGPSWSPDGDQIVFARNNAQGYPGELYIAKVDGSGERQLTGDGFENARPSWSPDGTQIVFQRTSAAPSGWNLWAIGVDGSGLRQISSAGSDLGPDWGSSLVVPEPSPPNAPTIQIFSPTDVAFYLPGMQVSAFYLCSSNVSFIVSCQGDVPVGAPLDLSPAGTHSFTVHAVDAAGRTATMSVSYQVPDLVAPTVDLRTPKDGASYDLGSAVTIDYSCADPNGSGVASCAGDRPSGATLDTSQPGTHRFTVLALDNAGNLATATATYTVVGPPQIQINSPADGASYTLGSVALAAYSCSSAAGLQVVSCAASVANGSALDTASIGTKTFTVSATDNSGRTATQTHTYTVLGPPQVQITSPTDGATYTLGSHATAAYSCSSPWGIPIVSCAGSLANGSALDTGSIGTKTFTVNATDTLGGTATSTHTYTVIYFFSGFEPPVSTTGSIDDAEAGDALPLKFSLQGNQGLNVITQTTWQPVSCTDWTNLPTPATTGHGKVSYTPSTDRYLDLVATDPTWNNSCRTLDLQLADGTHHTIHVHFTH